MLDYTTASKEELVERLKEIEKKLKDQVFCFSQKMRRNGGTLAVHYLECLKRVLSGMKKNNMEGGLDTAPHQNKLYRKIRKTR